MRLSHLVAVYCLAATNCSFAQDKISPKKWLEVGDTFPNGYFQKTYYGEGKALNLSTFKGKLLLLDLWAVNCTVCLVNMPKMEELQKQFGDKIQVVLITKNTDEQVERLRKRIKIVQNVKLPMITNDTALTKLFSYRSVPTHVWIDEKGVVRQITQSWNTTASAIQQHLDGKTVILPQKNEKSDFDTRAPLWLEGGGRQSKNLQYYSYIMKRVSDAGISMHSLIRDSITKNLVSVKVLNLSITSLYQIAFSGTDKREFTVPTRTLNETGDSSLNRPKGSLTEKELWSTENTYCYELRVPPGKEGQLFKFMQEDLERFFSIKGSIERRKVKCLVLSRKTSPDKIRSSKKEIVSRLSPDEKQIVIKNLPLRNLVRLLENIYWRGPYPIVDETGYKGAIDIELNGDLKNPGVLQEEFKRYGFELTIQDRLLEMLVLRKLGN
jgi:thiol-disulfide isomerase/thioredoxin